MNIFVTQFCLNGCKYCFAKLFMMGQKYLTRKNAWLFLWFLIKNTIKRRAVLPELNIMGGEPFLYKDLGWFLRLLNRFRIVKQITVFTGGNVPTENLKMLDKKCHVCLNLNERKDYKQSQDWDLITKNLATLIDEMHIRVALSYNIYSLDFNGEEIIDIAQKFGIEHIRIAIASPIYNHVGYTQLVHPKDYRELAPKVFDFVKACNSKGIKVNLDCRVPYCFFTKEQIGWFVQNDQHITGGIKTCLCGGPICISPDLMVSKCTVFSEIEEPLSKFSSIDDIFDFIYHSVDSRFGIPDLYDHCKICEHNTYCSGGCPAWKENFHNNPDEVEQNNEVMVLMQKNIELYQKQGNDIPEFRENERTILEKVKYLPRRPDPLMYYLLSQYYCSTDRKEEALRYSRLSINANGMASFNWKIKTGFLPCFSVNKIQLGF